MHDNFISLDSAKRDRIINAAMREFSSKGFKNASTNEIVKNAGISKGALFHYFSTKDDLFDFLYSYSLDFYIKAAEPQIGDMSADIFERWFAFAAIKLEIAAQYPDMADFIAAAFKESVHEVSDKLKAEYIRFSTALRHKVHDGIDMTRFREDVDLTKVLQIIWWVLEGYSTQKIKEQTDITVIAGHEFIASAIEEIREYMDILKKSFYKEEYVTNQRGI